MFNLFNKKSETSKEVLVAELPAKTQYPTIVDEIHNEFFTAGDNILQEATCLLKELEVKDLAKGKRLAALGFGKTREAVVAIETENKLATTKEIADLVMYYRINYPNNKFITEEQVKQICEKYGLVCGETSMYKGFVPENKLKLIEGFKIKEQDNGLILSNGVFLKGAEVRRNCISTSYFHIYKSTEPKDSTRYGWQSNDGVVFYSSDSNNIFNVGDIGRFSVESSGLKICAPLKDMEIPPNKKVEGYKISTIHVPDPVVLHPVHKGYLILAAWGDEASDEIVVNEINN